MFVRPFQRGLVSICGSSSSPIFLVCNLNQCCNLQIHVAGAQLFYAELGQVLINKIFHEKQSTQVYIPQAIIQHPDKHNHDPLLQHTNKSQMEAQHCHMLCGWSLHSIQSTPADTHAYHHTCMDQHCTQYANKNNRKK